ncbi:hypothetical protein C0989_000009 [Termitomyces sp. Mn162]|nr:hypothetical protein C0989_000009 [Termitomyces sp. Mn162]
MLPDEKLRALVSLYHQADSFITLDNLSDRIDAAFTGHSTINLGSYTSSVKSMRDDLERRRMEARVTEWDKATANSSRDVDNYSQGWSRIKKRREIRVKHALHGMSDEGDLPGLEVVKDGIEGTKFSRQLHSDVRDLLSNKGPSNWRSPFACHDSYPGRFTIDTESPLLGSIKPYRRQVVISTGKTDWDREVTETRGSLAALLSGAKNVTNLPIAEPTPPATPSRKAVRTPAGVFRSSDSTRISILNGSHNTIADDIDQETVLVFPDFTCVTNIPRTREGARGLWEWAVDPAVERGNAIVEKSPFKTWILPYSCVILLCQFSRGLVQRD